MRQCPDCEEKDRVVIAGKIFCANCGAPWEPADPTEATAYQQKIQPKPSASLSQGAISAAPNPTMNADQAGSSVVTSTPPPAPVQSSAAGQMQATSSSSTSVPSPVPAPAPALVPAPAPAPAPAAPPAPLPVAPPAPAPAAPAPAPAPAPAAPAPAPAPAPVPAPTPVAPAPAPAPVAPPAPDAVVAQASNNSVTAAPPSVGAPLVSYSPSGPLPESTIGAEIHSLDDKDESVLSDQQIKEMVETQLPAQLQQVRPSTPTSPPPVTSSRVDAIKPPPSTPVAPPSSAAPKLMTDIASPAAAIASAAPSANQASQVSAPASTTSSVTPNAPMMTREEALKLALGEDADVATTAQPAGPARPTAVVMAVMGLVLLGAFLWRVNAPDISLRLAALRSGLTASVPGFIPEGWSRAQAVKTGDGSLSYQMLKDGKNIQINQQKTDWDSQAVLDQYVLKRSSQYLALQASGLTIYLFDKNQAAWVNQGVLYTIAGSHDLNQEELIRMATSL